MSLNELCQEEMILAIKHEVSQRLIHSRTNCQAHFFSLMLPGYLLIFIFVERMCKNDILSLAFKLELFPLIGKRRYQLSKKKSVLSKIIATRVCVSHNCLIL